MADLRQALNELAQHLQSAGIERARFEARLLAAHALGVSVEKIVADDRRQLSDQELHALTRLAEERAQRRPMAQILGWREFYGRRFKVTPDVLTPRPDSETLIDTVLDHITDRAQPLRLLELGVGSGCLLLTLLAELPQARGVGIDISAAALAVARGNAEALGLSQRCTLVEGDWSTAATGAFDIVLSNPPYIPTGEIERLDAEVSRYEPRVALDGGEDGFSFYRRISRDCERALTHKGLIALEIGAGQGDDVADLLQTAGFAVLERRCDLAGIERCILARAP